MKHPTLPLAVLALAVVLLVPASPAFAFPAAAQSCDREIAFNAPPHYEARICRREERLERAEARPAEVPSSVAPDSGALAATAQSPPTPAAEDADIARDETRTGDSGFNPELSLILQGGFSAYSQDPETYYQHLREKDVELGGEAGLQSEGMALWETELIASANVDNLFYGQVTFGGHLEEGALEIDLEEAFVDTLSLPGGLGLRFGRFFSSVGYLNEIHSHAWHFADEPLAHRLLLGGQYRDDGVRASWVAPTRGLFVELGAEALRGGAYPAGEHGGDFGATRNFFAHVGGDIGPAVSWQAGASFMDIDIDLRSESAHGHAHSGSRQPFPPLADASVDLLALDLVWKYNPNPRSGLILQGEYLRRAEDGARIDPVAGNTGYESEDDGWYLQGVVRFQRHWRAGLRYDKASTDHILAREVQRPILGEDPRCPPGSVCPPGVIGFETATERVNARHRLERWSAMIDWTPTEFSRLRLQFNLDDSRGRTDQQWFLQYIMSIGAHGAHAF